MKNYGKIDLGNGDRKRVYVNEDTYTGETIGLSTKMIAWGDWNTIGYVDINNSYFPPEWFEIFEIDVYELLEKNGIIEKDMDDIYRFK